MTLEECITKRPFIEEVTEFSIKHKDINYTFKIGDKVNQLTIIKLGYCIIGNKNPVKNKYCICKCDCGNYVGPSRLISLLNGDLISCGCYQRKLHSEQMKKRNHKHGCSNRGNIEHLYILWNAMIDRTTNSNRWDSKYYSNKGITVCEEWKEYINFKDWAINNGYSEGKSIDRIDNSIGYNPYNCRWVLLKEQNRNKTTNRWITINGETKILADWCRERNLNSKLVSSRLSRGWSEERALEFI